MTTEGGGGGGGGDGVGGTRPISVPLITLMLFSSDSDGASPPCDPLSYSHMKKKKIEGCTKAEKRARVAASLFSSSLYTQAGAQMRCFHSAASLLYPHESHPPLGGVTSPAPAYLLSPVLQNHFICSSHRAVACLCSRTMMMVGRGGDARTTKLFK